MFKIGDEDWFVNPLTQELIRMKVLKITDGNVYLWGVVNGS